MKNEWAAVQGDIPRKFSRRPCEHCARETIFQAGKCLTCGIYSRAVTGTKAGKWNGQRSYQRALSLKRLGEDKREFYRRAAEASRAKFEGKS